MSVLTDEQREWIDGLRALADLFEKNGEHLDHIYSQFAVNLFVSDAEGLLNVARELGGRWNKYDKGPWFCLVQDFGPHRIDINVDRANVCEQVEVGVETVMIPDPDAPKVEITRPVYEWKCPESLNELASA